MIFVFFVYYRYRDSRNCHTTLLNTQVNGKSCKRTYAHVKISIQCFFASLKNNASEK